MKRKITKYLIAFLLMIITSSVAYAENNFNNKNSQLITNENANTRSSSMSSAIPINLNQTYNGVLPSYKGKVWYKFTLTQDGYIDSNILASLSTRYSVDIVNSKGEYYISYYTHYGDSISSVRYALPKGTYYIVISNHDNTSYQEDYEFSVNFNASQYWEKEFNNSISTADTIELNKIYRGMSTSKDKDYFKFTLPKDGYIDLNMSRLNSSKFKVNIKSANDGLYDSFTTTYGEGYETNRLGLQKGTYYIEIYSDDYEYWNEQYSFSVNFKASDFWEKESNDSFSSSDKINLNTTYYGVTDINSYKDFYNFNLTDNSTVSLKISNSNYYRYYISIYDKYENYISSFSTLYGSGYTTNKITLPSGRYYVKIEKYNSSDSKSQYSLSVNLPYTSISCDKVYFDSTYVTGKTTKNAKVSAKIGNKTYNSTANSSGLYKISIPKQSVGTVIKISSSAGGYLTKTISTTVMKKDIPTFNIDNVYFNSNYVSGKTLNNSKVSIKIGDKTYSGNSFSNGKFSIKIPNQKVGTSINVTVSKNNYNTKSKTITVKKRDISTLNIDNVYFNSNYVSGKTLNNSKVSIKIGNKTYSGNSSSNGKFNIKIPSQKVGVSVKVTVSKNNYNTKSKTINVKKRNISNLTINTVRNTHTFVSGKTLAGSTISVKINSKTYKTTANSSGYFKVSIPKQKTKTKINVTVSKANYNSKSTTINVK